MRNNLEHTYSEILTLENIPEKDPGKAKVVKEREKVVYAKIVDFEELGKATSKEKQEQWEIRVPKSDAQKFFGQVRARCTDNKDYVLCIKTLEQGSDDRDEWEIKVTRAVFEMVKKIADSGMIKTRYVFPVTEKGQDLKWEVDIFEKADGSISEWCKIDLEYSGEEPDLKYPISLDEILDVQPVDRTEEQKDFVDRLMNEEFLKKNAFSTQ